MDKVLVKLNVTVKAVITTGLHSKREDDQINARGSRVTDIGGGVRLVKAADKRFFRPIVADRAIPM